MDNAINNFNCSCGAKLEIMTHEEMYNIHLHKTETRCVYNDFPKCAVSFCSNIQDYIKIIASITMLAAWGAGRAYKCIVCGKIKIITLSDILT